MIQQIQNKSTWRHDTYTLKPGLNEIYFNDTRPNAFYVVNNNNTYLYVGLKNIPTNNRYERKIRPNECDCFGRPLPVDRIYIINPKDTELYVEVSSIHENFTLELLKSINASMDDEQINRIRFDGIINGWQTDDIVMTSIINLKELKDPIVDKLQGLSDLQSICNQKNELSNLKLDELKSKLDNITTQLDDIILYYNQSINKIDELIQSTIKVTKFDTLDAATYTSVNLADLILLSNDSDTDLSVSTGDNNIILKAGECLSDIYNINGIISIEPVSDVNLNTLPCRIIYTKKTEVQ